MKSFYNFLIKEMESLTGLYEDFVQYTPYIFRVLCDMTNQKIDKDDRIRINSALAYFVLPNDIVPENLYGPVGYTDDLLVCTTVINELLEKYGREILERCWHHDDDMIDAVKKCYTRSREFLESKGLVRDVAKYLEL